MIEYRGGFKSVVLAQFFSLLVAPLLPLQAQTPNPGPVSTVTGNLRFHELGSKIFNNTRKIRVLLPAGYDDQKNKTRRYPVLYLNDGQNLFDVATSLFNPMEWRVDETVTDLVRRGVIEPIIVVGIDNAGRRMRFNEYFPYEDEFLQPPMPSPQGRKYPDFVTDEVKPLVDRLYRTKSGRENTAIGGSSAGAIAALQAVIAKPKVFGLLLMESPSLYISNQQMLRDSKGTRPVKVYLGVGTNEMGQANCKAGDRDSEAVQDVFKLQDVLLESGVADEDLKLLVEECAIHNEEVWAKRFPVAIEFLFSKREERPPAGLLSSGETWPVFFRFGVGSSSDPTRYEAETSRSLFCRSELSRTSWPAEIPSRVSPVRRNASGHQLDLSAVRGSE